MATSTITTSARKRYGDSLPFGLVAAAPIPSLTHAAVSQIDAATDQARAMNAVLEALTAILATDGAAHVR